MVLPKLPVLQSQSSDLFMNHSPGKGHFVSRDRTGRMHKTASEKEPLYLGMEKCPTHTCATPAPGHGQEQSSALPAQQGWREWRKPIHFKSIWKVKEAKRGKRNFPMKYQQAQHKGKHFPRLVPAFPGKAGVRTRARSLLVRLLLLYCSL